MISTTNWWMQTIWLIRSERKTRPSLRLTVPIWPWYCRHRRRRGRSYHRVKPTNTVVCRHCCGTGQRKEVANSTAQKEVSWERNVTLLGAAKFQLPNASENRLLLQLGQLVTFRKTSRISSWWQQNMVFRGLYLPTSFHTRTSTQCNCTILQVIPTYLASAKILRKCIITYYENHFLKICLIVWYRVVIYKIE